MLIRTYIYGFRGSIATGGGFGVGGSTQGISPILFWDMRCFFCCLEFCLGWFHWSLFCATLPIICPNKFWPGHSECFVFSVQSLSRPVPHWSLNVDPANTVFLSASPKAKAGLGVQSLRPSVCPSVPKSCYRTPIQLSWNLVCRSYASWNLENIRKSTNNLSFLCQFFINEITASDAGPDIIRSHLFIIIVLFKGSTGNCFLFFSWGLHYFSMFTLALTRHNPVERTVNRTVVRFPFKNLAPDIVIARSRNKTSLVFFPGIMITKWKMTFIKGTQERKTDPSLSLLCYVY